MGVEIAAPGLTDLDELTELWMALVQDQRAYGTRLRVEANAGHARAWLSTRMTFDGVRVAHIEDALVGFVTFELMRDQFEREGQDGIVHNLYVAEEYRDEGIGSTLLECAESVLRDRGADRIRLELLLANERADEFYRERGYAPYRAIYRKAFNEIDTHISDGD